METSVAPFNGLKRLGVASDPATVVNDRIAEFRLPPVLPPARTIQ
jgi:hypothetical protein